MVQVSHKYYFLDVAKTKAACFAYIFALPMTLFNGSKVRSAPAIFRGFYLCYQGIYRLKNG
ncbi:MAG: hypothetical protein OXC40_01140 [Proteobacteria bacterium]|nr:hypothetical protein [Pseudomonadota bacterium]